MNNRKKWMKSQLQRMREVNSIEDLKNPVYEKCTRLLISDFNEKECQQSQNPDH